MKVKRDVSVIGSFLKINFLATISMKRSRRELSINVVFIGLSLKITKLHPFPVLSSYPKQMLDYPKQE